MIYPAAAPLAWLLGRRRQREEDGRLQTFDLQLLGVLGGDRPGHTIMGPI